MKLSDLLHRDMIRDRYRMQLLVTSFITQEALVDSTDKTVLVVNALETMYRSWIVQMQETLTRIQNEGIEDDITPDPTRLTTGYFEVEPQERGYYRPSDPLPDIT